MLLSPPSRRVINALAAFCLVAGLLNLAIDIRFTIYFSRLTSMAGSLRATAVIAALLRAVIGLGAIVVAVFTMLRPTSRTTRVLSAFLAFFLCQIILLAVHPLLPPPSVDLTTPLTTSEKALGLVNLLTLALGYLIYRGLRSWLALVSSVGASTPN